MSDLKPGDTLSAEIPGFSQARMTTYGKQMGTYGAIHTDPEFSKTTPFGKQIAHGVLGLSYALGLAWKTGMLDGTVIAFREINEWKFVKPVFIGDSIYVEMETVEAKALPRIGGGSVTIAVEIKNQNDEVCHRGRWTVLMVSKPK